MGARLVNWTEPEYPQSLVQIYDPPVMLYLRGDVQILNEPTISVVDTRRPTAYELRAPNQLIKQGAKLVTSAADIIEELPTPVRAALLQAETAEPGEHRNLLAGSGLNGSQKTIYEMLNVEEPRPIETSGLNSSEVLATLFDLERKGMVRQPPGKQFSRLLL